MCRQKYWHNYTKLPSNATGCQGGSIVGSQLKGKVVIINDAISLGISVRESIKMTRNAGATPAVMLIVLDRMQRLGKGDNLPAYSAVQKVSQVYGVAVISIVNLKDLFECLSVTDITKKIVRSKI